MKTRRRLYTNFTTESMDSGISSIAPQSNLQKNHIDSYRNIRPENILWMIVFALTVWYFELPMKLLVDYRVHRPYLLLSAIFLLLFLTIGFISLFVVARPNHDQNRWFFTHSKLLPLALFVFLISCVLFCVATWEMYNVWSIYVVFVTVMSTQAFVSFL
ncbi:hypothetical protein AB6A40_007551 [Gnathostoma spinigerum]|uniref:Transmembrane protein n=1 Tax=Gnathostoma spinigerum TaxID=75299 RepID=A0ABD6EW88_9BILA